MGERILSDEAFAEAERTAKSFGGSSVTSRAQQHLHDTGELHELVDPAGHGLIRRSISRKDKHKKDKYWMLTVGTAMPVELRLDTTGSMGNNVDKAFSALPHTYRLLAQVPGAVLGRYDTQVCNAIFNDVNDRGPVLCRTQFEMDVEIANQLARMIPLGQGDDAPEDPQYGMFGSAFLTAAEIHQLGLKGYDFTVTDASAHGDIDLPTLKRVFGDQVLEKVKENGHKLDEKKLPQMGDIIQELLKRSHAFMLCVGNGAASYWRKYYGKARVIILPHTEHLPHVQAAIIGLTEGTLNLQNLEKFLVEQGGLKPGEASQILNAVSGIPIGAQAALANFSKIPVRGDCFANKTDLWPISEEDVELDVDDEPEGMWEGKKA